MYGGGNQYNATCYIYNANGAAGSVNFAFGRNLSRIGILSGTTVNNNIAVTTNCPQAPASLPAGSACYIQAGIVNTLAHTCRIIVNQNNATLRVNLEVRDTTTGLPTVLQRIDGQKQ